MSRKRAWLAAALSFLVSGLGQLIGGRFRRAGVLLGLQSVINTAFYVVLLLPFGGATFVLPAAAALAWQVWVARDAFRINRVPPDARVQHSRLAWAAAGAAFAVGLYALGEVVNVVRWRFIGPPFRLSASSMSPTLLAGDFLMGRPLGDRPVRRGEIVVFQWPVDTTRAFVKRIVGLPGDTLDMRDGVLAVNGRPQREDYAVRDSTPDHTEDEFRWQENYLAPGIRQASAHRPSRDNWGPVVVPQDSYFVLGDARNNSLDSRYWGFVRDDQLSSVAWRIYFSIDSETRRVRWGRIGRLVEGGGFQAGRN